MSGCVESGAGNALDARGLGGGATRAAVVFDASGLANGVEKGVAQPPRTSAIAQPITAENKLARVDDMRSFEGQDSVDGVAPSIVGGPNRRKTGPCWQAQDRVDAASRAASEFPRPIAVLLASESRMISRSISMRARSSDEL